MKRRNRIVVVGAGALLVSLVTMSATPARSAEQAEEVVGSEGEALKATPTPGHCESNPATHKLTGRCILDGKGDGAVCSIVASSGCPKTIAVTDTKSVVCGAATTAHFVSRSHGCCASTGC